MDKPSLRKGLPKPSLSRSLPKPSLQRSTNVSDDERDRLAKKYKWLVADILKQCNGGRINVSIYCASHEERRELTRLLCDHPWFDKFDMKVETGVHVPRG